MTADVIASARFTGQKIILGSVGLLSLVAPAIAMARGMSVWPYAAICAGLFVLSLIAARGQGLFARLALATALMTTVMVITASLAGHPWQLDSHMIYFAALAGLVVLVDIRALLLAAGLVAVQHLSLSIALPSLIYPAADLLANLQRAAVHGVILIAEACALIYTVWLRHRQVMQSLTDQARVNDALEQAQIAQAEVAKVQAGQQDVVAALKTELTRLAERNLSCLIDTAFPREYDQLRRDYNSAIAELSRTIAAVTNRATFLSSDAGRITQATDDLSRRTETQAATLEQTAAALDEITTSVKSAAEAAAEVADFVSETMDKAQASGALVGTAVTAMSEIEKRSGEISQIIGVIDDIAFQTNLLALNAGVEAARAGEAGKGFAVVASEVRALAQRSSDAARDIKALISGSSRQVNDGAEMVNKVGDALMEIIARVEQISDFVGKIANGASEQAQGLNEINTGVVGLDQVTQQNASMVEQCTEAARSLGAHAADLRGSMQRFTLGRADADAATAPSRQYSGSSPDHAHGLKKAG